MKKNKLTPRAVWKATPDGTCPDCQKIIENDEEVKIFRSQKRKKCHLECYKKRLDRRNYLNSIWIIDIIAMLGFLIWELIAFFVK